MEIKTEDSVVKQNSIANNPTHNTNSPTHNTNKPKKHNTYNPTT